MTINTPRPQSGGISKRQKIPFPRPWRHRPERPEQRPVRSGPHKRLEWSLIWNRISRHREWCELQQLCLVTLSLSRFEIDGKERNISAINYSMGWTADFNIIAGSRLPADCGKLSLPLRGNWPDCTAGSGTGFCRSQSTFSHPVCPVLRKHFFFQTAQNMKSALCFLHAHPELQTFYCRFDVICFDFLQQFAKTIQQDFLNLQDISKAHTSSSVSICCRIRVRVSTLFCSLMWSSESFSLVCTQYIFHFYYMLEWIQISLECWEPPPQFTDPFFLGLSTLI